MIYLDFKLSELIKDFELTINEESNLLSEISSVNPSSTLIELLKENLDIAVAINTEKARSEMIIAPVLWEIRRQLNYRESWVENLVLLGRL